MRASTLIFGVLMLVISLVGGCRTELSPGTLPLARLTAGELDMSPPEGVVPDIDAEVGHLSSISFPDAQMSLGGLGRSGPSFAKLPLRRIVRPNELPVALAGYVSAEHHGTKSLQRIALTIARRGPPFLA